MPEAKRFAWKNWAENLSMTVSRVRPESLEALQEVMRDAKKQNRRVRVLGGGYSWSPLVGGEQNGAMDPEERERELERVLLVDMTELKSPLGFDPERQEIHVECGMTIEGLSGELAKIPGKQRYTLVSPTLFPLPTVGGVISVGGHGTGREWGNFSDNISQLTIVKTDGEKVVLEEEDADFEAARVSLGALGVLYSAKIRVVPEFNVYVDRRYLPYPRVIDQIDSLSKSSEFLEIFYWPLQDRIWVYVMNRTESLPDAKTPWTRLKAWLGLKIQMGLGGSLLPWIASRAPLLTPLVCKLSGHLVNEVNASVKTATEAFHFLKAYPKAWDLSYAIPMRHTTQAWKEAIELVEEYSREKLYPINLVIHCRVTGKSKAWLAPNQEERTCFIEVATAKGTPDPLWREFFATLERRWFELDGSRPHWGKLSTRASDIRQRYAEMESFLEVREKWDPERILINPYLAQVFGMDTEASETPGTDEPSSVDRSWSRASQWTPFRSKLY